VSPIRSNVCLYVSEGAKLRSYMTKSNQACVEIGEVDHELTFDYPTFRELVTGGSVVLAQMETKAAEEEAEWAAEQAKRLAEEQAQQGQPAPRPDESA
jgi:hypothetical protein